MIEKIFVIIMYVLWIVSIAGILAITFTNFQYPDLNVIVGIIFFFTIINSIITVKRK